MSVLSQLTHFCVEQKWTQNSCLWSKNDKYDVWSAVQQLIFNFHSAKHYKSQFKSVLQYQRNWKKLTYV